MTETASRTRRAASYPEAVTWIAQNTDTTGLSETNLSNTVALVAEVFKRGVAQTVKDVLKAAQAIKAANEDAADQADINETRAATSVAFTQPEEASA